MVFHIVSAVMGQMERVEEDGHAVVEEVAKDVADGFHAAPRHGRVDAELVRLCVMCVVCVVCVEFVCCKCMCCVLCVCVCVL